MESFRCPYCNSGDFVLISRDGFIVVVCLRCGAEEETPEEA